MSVGTFDPRRLVVTVNGVIVSGFAGDEAVTVTQNNDDFMLSVGMDGDTTRIRTNDRSAEVMIRLQQTSLSNGYLTALRNTDINSPLGVVVRLQIEDLSTGSSYIAPQAWLKGPPSVGFSGSDATDREWTFQCAEMFFNTQGVAL